MWARVIEVMLGCWLAMSPFIFRHSAEDRVLWFNDLFGAMVVIMLALISFWPPLRFAHVANLVIALWLIAFGFWASSYPAPPALQNDIVVGLLLLMFAIVPNKATRPPRPWRDFFARGRNNVSLPQS
jgi:multisubunit Na+/H+ antiporter MnhF subunit